MKFQLGRLIKAINYQSDLDLKWANNESSFTSKQVTGYFKWKFSRTSGCTTPIVPTTLPSRTILAPLLGKYNGSVVS